MKYLLTLLSLLTATVAQADGVASIGVGKGIFGDHGTAFERVAAVGYQYNHGDFFVRPEAGAFMDISGSGRSSFWIAPLAGVRALSKTGPELHVGMGPGFLQNPDSILGGHFQFSLEGGAGITSESVYVGIAWKHLSSAGIEMPNQGRDFITIQLRVFAF